MILHSIIGQRTLKDLKELNKFWDLNINTKNASMLVNLVALYISRDKYFAYCLPAPYQTINTDKAF
jgi:hypothetical protein